MSSDEKLQKFHGLLGNKGMMRLILLLLAIGVVALISAYHWHRQLGKMASEKPVLERLVPVLGKAYFLRPDNGEPVAKLVFPTESFHTLSLMNTVLLCDSGNHSPIWM